MNIQNYLTRLIEFAKYSVSDPNIELEMRLKDSLSDKLSQETFIDIIKRVKGIPGIKVEKPLESLDIFYEYEPDKLSNIRVSVNGNGSVKRYCTDNNFTKIHSSNLQLIKKKLLFVDGSGNIVSRGTKVNPIDINEYKLRVNIKTEDIIPTDGREATDISTNWTNKLKVFRYKKRYSFITNDNNFRFDFSIIKSSKKIMESSSDKTMKKENVSEFQKKFVMMPTDVLDKSFTEWWEDLPDDAMVTLKGKKFDKMVAQRTLQDSKTLINDQEYEVELEYIGNKNHIPLAPEDVVIGLIKNFGIILQAKQKSYFITSEIEKIQVRNKLKELFGSHKFQGPMNVTLEKKHILKHQYDAYKDNSLISIRRGYSVTDKADGDRTLLIILDNDSAYIINRNNNIKYLGASLVGLGNTIIDGEYITKNKNGENISLFMAFDIYFHRGEDLRNRHLNRPKGRGSTRQEQSRLEFLEDIFKGIELQVDSEDNNLELFLKKFSYGDIYDNDETNSAAILSLKQQMESLDTESAQYKDLEERIQNMAPDRTIFEEAKKLYEKDYPYNIDGLIFTPVELEVGEEPDKSKKNQFNGRWYRSFKWKPPEENTIDFLVEFEMDDGKPQVEYVEINSKSVPYIKSSLNVGYDPSIHTKHNSCRVLNENLIFQESYHPVAFQPLTPYIKDIHIANIIIESGNPQCLNGDIITDRCIIECKYDSNKDGGFRWIPMRVRNTKTPNDFITASNVWNSIHYPVTLDMITTGENILQEGENEYTYMTYYKGTKKRDNYLSKPLADFHSYVKKRSISKYSKANGLLLDIGCGKAGDMNHWIDSKLSMVVGIDISKDNLENVNNGACNRILDKRASQDTSLLNNILFIWGDSSKLYSDGSAGLDDINKYYLDIIYGNISKGLIQNKKLRSFHNITSVENGYGFDIVSSQFNLHYFLKDAESLANMFTNVSSNLKPGGVFVGNCLDGKEVMRNMGMSPFIQKEYKGKLVWKISKGYSVDTLRDDESCLGQKIDVYFESINQTLSEYLVNFDYLKTECTKYGLELRGLESFSDLYQELTTKGIEYGDASKLNDVLREYSFMNKSFMFVKL